MQMQMQAQRQSPLLWKLSTASAAAVSGRIRSSAVTFCLQVDEKRFIEASKTGNIIPLHKCIFSDHLTPVMAYRCLVNEDDKETPSFLYESVEPGFRASSVVRLDQYSSAQKAYEDGMKRLETLVSKVQDIDLPRLAPAHVDFCTPDFELSRYKRNMTSEEYTEAVLQSKEHILGGDIFQIVLSQRFERRTFADPFQIYL
ncbi:hypothetical protein SASPL_101539 [Salvia splendens]|uniref:Uncharacterized protein n=1 Tax=Salvia splendens TaxID=180675 RepID=A0A8X9ABB0_SALSN|nr:hypothetical protein SASPL_101539 [Salvia splendens]